MCWVVIACSACSCVWRVCSKVAFIHSCVRAMMTAHIMLLYQRLRAAARTRGPKWRVPHAHRADNVADRSGGGPGKGLTAHLCCTMECVSLITVCLISVFCHFWLNYAWVLSLDLSWKVTHGKIVNITRYMNVKVGASLPVSYVFRQPPHACNPLLHLYLGTCRHRFLVD